MPRPHKCRLISNPPAVTAFKPAGVPASELDAVELRFDELEALRLADLEGLYHDAAAERMGVSRPTFGRLIQAARHKVATALLTGRMLMVQGGSVSAGSAEAVPPGPPSGRRRRWGCGCGGRGHSHGAGGFGRGGRGGWSTTIDETTLKGD